MVPDGMEDHVWHGQVQQGYILLLAHKQLVEEEVVGVNTFRELEVVVEGVEGHTSLELVVEVNTSWGLVVEEVEVNIF